MSVSKKEKLSTLDEMVNEARNEYYSGKIRAFDDVDDLIVFLQSRK